MLTIVLTTENNKPLYQQIYENIRQSIADGQLKAGERLPSKRSFAQHLQVSVSTVENAYAQLLAEGYMISIEKKGYFIRSIEKTEVLPRRTYFKNEEKIKPEKYLYDLKTNAVDTDHFPFSVWSKLGRQSLNNDGAALLEQQHFQGNPELRKEITRYLRRYRGMNVSPEQIVIGSGIEYLLGLITELIPGSIFALEHPCYIKQLKILNSKKIGFELIPIDSDGIQITGLKKSAATAALITPSRHFPLGTITSINRRLQLIKWVSEKSFRYIIEDDFDCEYRYSLRQIPTIFSLDNTDSVLYLNTFARTLAPSLRIAYMVLPPPLIAAFRQRIGFYSGTVSSFEQNVLCRFIKDGYYERHLNHMRVVYRKRRDTFLEALKPLKQQFEISCHEAGLHLLIRSLGRLTEKQLIFRAGKANIKVYGLSGYYWKNPPESNSVIVGYGKFCEDDLKKIARLLITAWLV